MAKHDASILILGETGTGKELCARAIHRFSPRASKPFVAVNCGAIPVELAENELFGHIPGAFTGADSPQPGLIREANYGTLFFDEIDSLPLLVQVKLLRFLQEKEYKELGSAKVHRADVRVIAATNSEIEEVVKEGKFRKDLFYRLSVIPFILPPLRERKEDIPLLARHFLAKYSSHFGKQITDFTPEAMRTLLLYQWPGNVRELENVIERAAVFSGQPVIHHTDIRLPHSESSAYLESFKVAKAKVIEQFERSYIEGILLTYQGNVSRAAKAAEKNRRAFWELIRKYRIDVSRFKAADGEEER